VAERYISLIGILVALGSLAVSWHTARASAKKDELEVLRGVIAELREEVERWKRKYGDLCSWVREQFGIDPESRKRVRRKAP